MRLPWKKPKREPGIVVHFAGNQFTFRNVSVQRCLWCGALIDRKDWTQIEVPGVEGKTYEQVRQEMFEGTWGGLVGVDVMGMPFHVPIPPNGVPPANACMWEGVDDDTIVAALAEPPPEPLVEAADPEPEPDPVQRREDQADDSLELTTVDRPPWEPR